MRGYPKHLNTREDYEYVRTHFPRVMWEDDFRGLLASMREWYFVSYLEAREDGVSDDTHRVIEMDDFKGGKQWVQYELRENPQADIFRMDYTEAEVRAILQEGLL